MELRDALATGLPVLAETAVLEHLRRDAEYQLEPVIDHARAPADPRGAALLRALAQAHIELAEFAELPMILGTPSFRAQAAKLAEVGAEPTTNRAGAQFMRDVRQELASGRVPIFINGNVGPRGDCYSGIVDGELEELRDYHRPQILDLVAGGVDFLQSATIPSLREAKAIALEMAETDRDYLISVVVRPGGRLPDGHDIATLIADIDDACVGRPPLGYGVNCSYPGHLDQVEANPRLIMLQANASATDPRLLEGSCEVDAASPMQWATAMETARVRLGLKILGGCCGTSPEHLRALVAGWS